MSKEEPQQTHFVVCSCSSPDHIVQFVHDDDSESSYGEVLYIQVQLHQYHPWYQRMWIALKYIFGYESRYGHWDCTTMNKTEARKLFEFLKTKTELDKDDNTDG